MKSERLAQFFQNDGKTVILPIDHGMAIPVPGLENPGKLIRSVKEFVDGFVVNLGVAAACRKDLKGSGVCLRIDVYKPDVEDGAYRIYGVDEAEAVDAGAMMHMLFPGHPNEVEISRDCCEAIADGFAGEMPTIIEALPCGLGMSNDYTVAKIDFAVRQAAELGADVVKTAYPVGATVAEFKKIVDACFVPVIVLGGAAMGDDKALLSMVKNAMDAGAVGIAVGRNVWQHPSPKLIAKKLHAVVHEGASVAKALKID
ncbi:MAG: DhnA family fructose-bisphosphate aldolase class Ia [Verrucomicrobiales bacterium]|jgi:DhnA family fructose-bisphosphate aldolase class Ia